MKLVCETLKTFISLNENLQKAKEAFKEAGYDEKSSEWNNFNNTFGNNPEFMGKFAEWIFSGKSKEEIDQNFEEIKEIYNDAIEYDLDPNPNSFSSLNDFTKKIGREVINAAKKGKEDIEKAIKDDNITISRLGLSRLVENQRALLCTPEVDKSPDKNKKGQGLYIWTEITLLHSWKGDYSKLKIKFKFGQFGAFAKTDIENQIGKTAGETISGYSGTYMSPKVVLYIKNLNDYFSKSGKNAYEVEHEIAEALRSKGWNTSTLTKSTEVYEGGTLEELIQTINETLSGTKESELIPRKEQREGIIKISDYLKNPKHKEFLLSAKMRYGKNATLLEAIKKLAEVSEDYKNNLVITYKPSVFSSLKNDIKKYSNYKDFDVIEVNKKNKEELLEPSEKIRIFISSAQYALYGSKELNESEIPEKLLELNPEEEVEELQQTSYEDYEKNIDKLKDIHFGLIIADEYHYGTKSKNFQNILKQLDFDQIVYVSGTAMKDMATGRFNDDQIFNWTYIDEQKAKEKEKIEKEKDPNGYYPHLEMPTMIFYKMNLSSEAISLAQDSGLYSADQGFSFTKLIDVDKQGKLVNEQLMRVLLKQIMDPKGGNLSVIGSNAKGDLSHMFWVMAKNVKGIKAVANLMREESMKEWFGNYEIIEATGNLNNDIDKVKNKIQEAENKDRGSITLSCYRFKEGTTVPEWHAVVMLDDGRSAEEYLQAIFRSQSPGRRGDEKDECYVFDFNPERLLSIYHDIAQWNSKTGKEPQFELIKEFLKYAPILQDDGNKMSPVDAQEIIDNFRLSGSFSEKMANERVFNGDYIQNVLDKDVTTYLSDISSKKNATEIKISSHGLDKAKNALTKRAPIDGGGGDEDEDQEHINIEAQKEKIRNVLRRIPTFLFASEVAEKGIEDIIHTNEPKIFEEICGVPPEFLQKLIDKKIISARVLNETIGYFHDIIDEVETNPTMDSAEEFFKKHLVMHGEESSTPKEIVNEMLDKLPEDIWKDKNKTFCDPVCGTGKFLIGIYERLMKGLESSIKDKEERSKWIIENMIYGVDNVRYKVIMAKKLLGNKPYKYNIEVKDSLNKETWKDMPKFDVVVGNPPYLKNIHLRFLKLAFEVSNKFVIFLEPASWVITEKNTFKDIKTLISEKTESIDIYNPYEIFENIYLNTPLLIIKIDKEKNQKGIRVKDHMIKKEFKTDSIYEINKWGSNPNYFSIKEKITNYVSKNGNLADHKNDKGEYYVNFAHVRGHINLKGINLFDTADFYSFIPWDLKPSKNKEKQFSIGFKSEEEAWNLINFLKTKFARFSLALHKIHINLKYDLVLVPWMDFSKEWSDSDLNEYFNLSENEINFINSNIPEKY